MSIENNFANGMTNISGAFGSSILGQAGSIANLQANGVSAITGATPQPPISVEGAIGALHQNPALLPQALQALQDPNILRQVLTTLTQNPGLIPQLPLQVQQFLHYLLSEGTGACR